MEERNAKILFNKSGGTSTGVTNRITLPTKWIKEMGFNLEDRDAVLSYDGEKIIITKSQK